MVRFILTLIGLVVHYGCVEPFEPKTNLFEDVLVIEATITNELKNQEILLGRTFTFEGFAPDPEEKANVKVVDESQKEYLFQEYEPGKYISDEPFGATPGMDYQLQITTFDGKKYTSEITRAPDVVPLEGLEASRIVNGNGEEGMSIAVTYNPNVADKYFRYEFEEMFKIVAPEWTDNLLLFLGPTETIVWPKESNEGRVCYQTIGSEKSIFNSPSTDGNDGLLQFPIRFINRDNYIISHRYGIWVKQYAINKETYTYLETLKEFGEQDNIFSQTQPGFFRGNVFSEDNPDEMVLGYFDVTAVDIKNVFFDYEDFFLGEPLPPYVDNCMPFTLDLTSLRNRLNDGSVTYHSSGGAFGAHFVVDQVCGDCRVLGESEVPENWIE